MKIHYHWRPWPRSLLVLWLFSENDIINHLHIKNWTICHYWRLTSRSVQFVNASRGRWLIVGFKYIKVWPGIHVGISKEIVTCIKPSSIAMLRSGCISFRSIWNKHQNMYLWRWSFVSVNMTLLQFRNCPFRYRDSQIKYKKVVRSSDLYDGNFYA